MTLKGVFSTSGSGTAPANVTGFSAASRTATGATTVVEGSDYLIRADATTAGFTVTLPASPTTNMVVNVKKIDATANVVTVSGNGHNIDTTATKPISTQFTNLQMQYDVTSGTWNIL